MAWRLILLDLDGTILDSAPGILAALRAAFDAVEVDAPDDAIMRSWIGPPINVTLERELGPRGSATVRAARAAFRARYDSTGVLEVDVYEGMHEAIGAMALEGRVLAVVTHKPAPLAERVLRAVGLRDAFASIHAPGSPGDHPSKEALVADALRMHAHAGDAVMAGDRDNDVHGALANGVPPIGVLWGYGTQAELTTAGALLLAARPSDLAEQIGRGGAGQTG